VPHRANNEGRPLLLIYGRDSDGKGFVVIRVFMPNETGAICYLASLLIIALIFTLVYLVVSFTMTEYKDCAAS
jgi:hypothetical protein